VRACGVCVCVCVRYVCVSCVVSCRAWYVYLKLYQKREVRALIHSALSIFRNSFAVSSAALSPAAAEPAADWPAAVGSLNEPRVVRARARVA
jgi:hypothetical protein